MSWDEKDQVWKSSPLPFSMPITTTGVLAVFCGGSADSFTGILLYLYAKADPGNKARLESVYPRETAAYNAWQQLAAPTAGSLTDLLNTLESYSAG